MNFILEYINLFDFENYIRHDMIKLDFGLELKLEYSYHSP